VTRPTAAQPPPPPLPALEDRDYSRVIEASRGALRACRRWRGG
jgi:hypothetical protein